VLRGYDKKANAGKRALTHMSAQQRRAHEEEQARKEKYLPAEGYRYDGIYKVRGVTARHSETDCFLVLFS